MSSSRLLKTEVERLGPAGRPISTCAASYGLYDSDSVYGGTGWYGKSRVIWWNQQSRNPSSADGSWTLTASHGPMDCVTTRSQICQWR